MALPATTKRPRNNSLRIIQGRCPEVSAMTGSGRKPQHQSQCMSDETKNNLPAADGFDDFAGDDQQFTRVIQGEKWQFTNEGTWVNGDDEEIPPDREVVASTLPG